MNLSPEQMQFLADKGLSTQDIIAFARIEAARSSGAERQARYRARKKAEEEAVTESDVTSDVTERDPSPSLSPSPNENNSNPHPHTHPDNTPRARKADPFPCPDWCNKAVWADLKKNRRAKSLANTETAHGQFVRDVLKLAEDGWPPGEVVREIVARGWGGAYDPRSSRRPANDRTTNHRPQTTSTRTVAQRALAAFEAGSG